MADCRWINANGGNWNTAANWSTGTVPTAADNVIIDAASFAANGKVITVDVIANCLNFDCSGADQTFTLANSAYAFNVYGSLTMTDKLTVSFTGTGYWYFKATNSVNIISGNKIIRSNKMYFNGSGGSWTNQDDFTVTGDIFLANGTWITNGKTITCSGILYADIGTKSLNISNSILNLFGLSTSAWHNGFTLVSSNSTINISGIFLISHINDKYNNINIITIGLTSQVTEVNCVNLTRTSGANLLGSLSLTGNIIVSGDLSLNGNNNNNYRLVVRSSVIGTQRTITCNGTLSAVNVDFIDIAAAGTASWDLSAIPGGSGDCGGNSGIIFTPSQKQYFKHTSGSCNWSDATKWFSDQAKTVPGRVPLPQDDVRFDEESFTGASTLTVNCGRIGRHLDMSTVNQSIVFALQNNTESYGSYILGPLITPSGSFFIYLYARNLSCTLNLFNKTIYCLVVNAIGSVYTNFSHITCSIPSTAFAMLSGTFDFNDFNFIGYFFYFEAGSLYLGNGILIANRISSFPFYLEGNLFAEGSTLVLAPSSGNASVLFPGNTKSYNKIIFAGNHTGPFDISQNNSFNELVIQPGRIVRFTAGSTQTIKKLTAIGTAANPITIGSITNAQHTLALAAGNPEVECDYLNISYSNATPANKFFAGSHSVNSGNNTGWIFADMARFFTWASASGIGSAAATLQLKNILQAIASGTSSAQAALQQLRQMVASAAGVTTANLQLHASRYITAIATGQATADSYAHVLLPIASAAQGTSAASLAMHELIYAVANVVGISVTEATLLVYAYPVEIFEAISKITTLVEARSVITTIITQNSKVF